MSDQRLHLGYDAKGNSLGAAFSRRAVRFRVLKPAEVAHARGLVYPTVDEHTKLIEIENAIATEGVAMMVSAFTEPCDPNGIGEAKWTKVTAVEMGEALKGDTFTTKDVETLKQVFHKLHHVSGAELDAIMGGIVGVVD